LLQFTKGVIAKVRAKESFSLEDGLKIILKIIEDPKLLDYLYLKALTSKYMDELLAYHYVNVCVYAIKIGLRLKYPKPKLMELAVAALLHDIGMATIPKGIIDKKGILNHGEMDIVRKIPLEGHKIILKLGGEYTWLAEVALQVHEREQGQGYPRSLEGDEIHEYAKLIGVVDVYEALTHERPHRKKFLPYDAVREMVQKQRDLFDHKILKALLAELSMFPPYSYVKLNSNVIGIVIETHESQPIRPTIQVLYDSQGKRLSTKKAIKLSESPLLHITECLYEEDLPG